MVALDEDDTDILGRTPVILCPGFPLLLEKAVNFLEVLFPASPIQMS